MIWLEERIKKVSEVETKEEINNLIKDLKGQLKYYKEHKKSDKYGGKFSDWAIHYYNIVPYLIKILKDKKSE